MRKAIFLDRDGTLIRDLGYINNPDHVELVEGVINTLKLLQSKGFLIIIISNQSGVSRGLISQSQFEDVHFKFISLLKEYDIKIDATYYCTHKEEDKCHCRKPYPKNIIVAKNIFKVDLNNSFMIGDKLSDTEAGNRAGCKTILLNSRFNELIKINKDNCPNFIAKDWNDILNFILENEMKTEFNISRLNIKSISEREHDYNISDIKQLSKTFYYKNEMKEVASKIIEARKNKKEVIFMMGAHVIKNGLQRYVIDLIEKGYITCVSTNGACVIHDYEFSLLGHTSENVAKYISEGQFGLWKETSNINNIINRDFEKGEKNGIGYSIGKEIWNSEKYPRKDISIFAACYRLDIPITVHVGIGYDIIHQHSNFDPAITGYMSYVDFLKLTNVVYNLEDGVLMSFGSATMAPEVFLKSLSMARNVAKQIDKDIKHFTTLVCDLHDLPKNLKIIPEKDDPLNFFRPWKTILVRTVSDGGKSFYIKGRHEETIPELWTAIRDLENL